MRRCPGGVNKTMNMDFLRTCSIVLLLVLSPTLPSVQGFGVVVGWKGPHPQCKSTPLGSNQRSPLSSLIGSGRVPVQSSSRVLLKANLFDWLNPSSSSSAAAQKKKEKEQQDNVDPRNTNPKETTHHKASATPVVADFLSQWFQTNTPPPANATATTSTPPEDDAASHVQPITTEIVESTTSTTTTTVLQEEVAMSHVPLVDHEPEVKPSVLQHTEVVVTPKIATTPTLHVTPPPVEATSTSTTTTMTSMEPPTTTTATIHKGRVLWFDPQRGYGFLVDDDDETTMDKDDVAKDDGKDRSHRAVFVHHSAIELSHGYFRTLIRGEHVEYQVEVDSRGRPLASHVTGPHGKPVKSILQQQLDGPPKKGTHPQ